MVLRSAGIFGGKALGSVGGVAFMTQVVGTGIALVGGFAVYGSIKAAVLLKSHIEGSKAEVRKITLHRLHRAQQSAR